ncbi:acyltransferase [Thauera aromatica]|jgi:acetyltransferase-like isoleucine patch superfamily enzyme|uniref:acyltransferase n=1 Tax=Thauera aromatica TaxID=59405 RepID=UPI001FFC8990|nr:acyltransferase [Thauera aromatica]MCK2086861.1 acyltransferase [Thauera aromatica]
MLTGLLRRVLRKCALEHNRLVGLYRRVCRPNNFEWAEYLRRHGGLHAMGEHCAVVPNVVITDPPHVSIGSNVSLSGCTLFGHGGGIPMLKRAYGVPLDKVGKIVIHDNVFIGHQAIVMPGVSIGPNAMVGAGSIVTRDVPPNSIVVGAPARKVGDLDEYVRRLAAETAALPWGRHPFLQPDYSGPPDAALHAMRMKHFFGDEGA